MREYYKNDILKLAKPYPTYKFCVYFLMYDEEIVYIGYSANVDSRIAAHRKDKHFNKTFKINQGSDAEALELEQFYIKKFTPLYNKSQAYHTELYKDRVKSFCDKNNLPFEEEQTYVEKRKLPTYDPGRNFIDYTKEFAPEKFILKTVPEEVLFPKEIVLEDIKEEIIFQKEKKTKVITTCNTVKELTNHNFNIPNNSFVKKEINGTYNYIIKSKTSYYITPFTTETFTVEGKNYMFDGKVFGNLCNHLI